MSIFAIYATATGVISGTVSAVGLSNAQEVCSSEQNAIEVPYGVADDTHYIDNGVATLYPPRPLPVSTWDSTSKTWVDPRTLADFKKAKVAEMKAARGAFALGTFQAAGFVFASDASSQTRIMLGFTKAQLQGAGFSEQWLLADGSVRTLTAANMQTLILALWDHIKLADTTLYTRTQQIAAAQTIPDVQSIVW